MDNYVGVVRCYHLNSFRALLTVMNEQMRYYMQLKSKFFLLDIHSVMIKNTQERHTKIVESWLNTGTIEAGTEIKRTALTNSIIGCNCFVEGQPNKEEPMSLNIGDNSSVVSK